MEITKKMKYLILLLGLQSCCGGYRHLDRDYPKLIYKQRVEVISGFYSGLVLEVHADLGECYIGNDTWTRCYELTGDGLDIQEQVQNLRVTHE